ncbi:hypothetical protein GCM10028805_27650 [Spirosoma harenae]
MGKPKNVLFSWQASGRDCAARISKRKLVKRRLVMNTINGYYQLKQSRMECSRDNLMNTSKNVVKRGKHDINEPKPTRFWLSYWIS